VKRSDRTTRRRTSTASTVRATITARGEGLIGYRDFPGLPATAVAASLSRLARDGELERVAKGIYYRSRPSVIGRSRPSAAQVRASSTRALIQPAGLTAANLLGFTTQNPAIPDYATTAAYYPAALRGKAHVVTRRPSARATLAPREAAILEVLRDRGKTSDLGGPETTSRMTAILRDAEMFERLVGVAASEPPRVRAILGAIGERAGQPRRVLERLRATLNPLSRFDFGVFAQLPAAPRWQAKATR
jgi:Family of unknown function (DUF6088)